MKKYIYQIIPYTHDDKKFTFTLMCVTRCQRRNCRFDFRFLSTVVEKKTFLLEKKEEKKRVIAKKENF